MKKITLALATVAGLMLAAPATAAPLCDAAKLGFAGLLAKCNRGEPINLSLESGKPLYAGEQPVKLQSGAYYELHIVADGSAELAITGPQFLRAIWMNEIVINDIEIRPMAIDSIEFDAGGTVKLSFVAIKPGTYDLYIPNTTGESQRVSLAIQ
ncbi:cupredoxin domain-containing protein [Methylobrevis albus]|uniref:MSP domain-containing protein n=1 Tax=Methylobrevis albus TaxID=2793297 RepID=A0A931MX57_9HYPH|nr:hypothetical protein [Methylobrevis albus]MBH0236320.1 hypothetical protein [Methylobrevis albus]